MPHCIVEHSNDIDSHTLMDTVFQAALASALFEADGADIKVRAMPFDYYQTGGDKASFIHLTVRLLSGRSTAQKRDLSRLIAKAMVPFSQQSKANVEITVDIQDMDRDCYSKII